MAVSLSEEKIIHNLGLERKLKNMPNNLSGRQQQRVAFTRALATKPAIILADEPTGNLDSTTSIVDKAFSHPADSFDCSEKCCIKVNCKKKARI